MKNKLYLGAFFVLPILLFFSWNTCTHLTDRFHYSSFDLSLRILEATNNDKGIPIPLVRAFHNKAVGTGMDMYRHFTYFWDIHFLTQLLSILGVFGLVCGSYFAVIQRHKIIGVVFILLIVFQLAEILKGVPIPYFWKIVFLSVMYQIIAVYGLVQFGKNNSVYRKIIFVTLFLLSIWWIFVFQHDIVKYCLP